MKVAFNTVEFRPLVPAGSTGGKDRIIYNEDGVMSICNSLRSMAGEIGGTAGDLSVARAIMEAMPGLMCSFSFGILNPVFSLAALVRRTIETGTVIYALTCARRQIGSLEDSIEELAKRVEKANHLLNNTESHLASFFSSGMKGDPSLIYQNAQMQTEAHYNSNGATDDPFDLNGQNGGNQGSPKNKMRKYPDEYSDTYSDIIRRNSGREFADDNELQAYLDEMNSVGCGYVAIMNAIIGQYKDRPADFERDFGIPLYKDGDYNYDEILVDVYSTINEPGESVSNANAADFVKEYFENKNLPAPEVTVKNQVLTAEKYREMVANGETKDGDLFIGVGRPLNMRYADGTESPYFGMDAGHGMTVIGTDGDYLLVSTWGDGKTYRIDPADYNDIGFFWTCQIKI